MIFFIHLQEPRNVMWTLSRVTLKISKNSIVFHFSQSSLLVLKQNFKFLVMILILFFFFFVCLFLCLNWKGYELYTYIQPTNHVVSIFIFLKSSCLGGLLCCEKKNNTNISLDFDSTHISFLDRFLIIFLRQLDCTSP